ncbi:hypothetical protein C7W88_17615 (plasmid) [Novosphingobium sp. THN1]|nr:hypothetical protein C7W88_17615 [Novosphingobium sp. THN1]
MRRVRKRERQAGPVRDQYATWLHLHQPDLQPVAAMGKTGEVRSHPVRAIDGMRESSGSQALS